MIDYGASGESVASELISLTVSGNSSNSGGDGIHLREGSVVNLRNSIVANNGSDSGVDVVCSGGQLTISASLIEK